MRKKKIAMFLAMALTLTQSVGMTVPVAAEELEIDAGQEEVFQDDSNAETTVDEETASGEEVSIQEEADETQDEVGREESQQCYALALRHVRTVYLYRQNGVRVGASGGTRSLSPSEA